METTLHIIDSMTMMASLALLYGIVSKQNWPPRLRRCLLGAAFGLGAALSMLQPIYVFEREIIDCRALFTGFAGAFLGLPGALTAIAVATIGRLVISLHPAALFGISGLILAAGFGLLWSGLKARMPEGWIRFLFLGLMISASFCAFLFLPGFGGTLVYVKEALMVSAVNVLGAIIFGAFIETERHRAEQERDATIAATTDALTGLLNRRGFSSRFAAAEAARHSKGSALLIVDLDHFKRVNDTFGHRAGDQVLRQMGERLRLAVRPDDLVLRLGGEEFAILLNDVAEGEVREVAARVRQQICAPCVLAENGAIEVTASLGGTCWKTGTQPLEIVFETADRALYQAKLLGRDRAVIV
jgi:diguanylate cyclase